jgi:hypothetical protein
VVSRRAAARTLAVIARSAATKQSNFPCSHGLLRFARNDGSFLRAGCEIIHKPRTIGKIAFVIGPTSKLPTIVLGVKSGDIDAMTHDAGASMLTDKFDPYGGMLPGDSDDKAGLSGMSSVLSRFGQIAFWALVVIVVVARMKYFSAGPYF